MCKINGAIFENASASQHNTQKPVFIDQKNKNKMSVKNKQTNELQLQTKQLECKSKQNIRKQNIFF